MQKVRGGDGGRGSAKVYGKLQTCVNSTPAAAADGIPTGKLNRKICY